MNILQQYLIKLNEDKILEWFGKDKFKKGDLKSILKQVITEVRNKYNSKCKTIKDEEIQNVCITKETLDIEKAIYNIYNQKGSAYCNTRKDQTQTKKCFEFHKKLLENQSKDIKNAQDMYDWSKKKAQQSKDYFKE